MPETMTKREWLVQKGLAKDGRGRFSADAKAALQKAINDGVKFAEPDKTAKTATVKTKDENGKTVVKTYRVSEVWETRNPHRPQGFYTFQNPDGSEFKRSHTNACNRCKWSFEWCTCLDGPVQFVYPHRAGMSDVYAVCVGVPDRALITTADLPTKQPEQGTRRGGRRTRRR